MIRILSLLILSNTFNRVSDEASNKQSWEISLRPIYEILPKYTIKIPKDDCIKEYFIILISVIFIYLYTSHVISHNKYKKNYINNIL